VNCDEAALGGRRITKKGDLATGELGSRNEWSIWIYLPVTIIEDATRENSPNTTGDKEQWWKGITWICHNELTGRAARITISASFSRELQDDESLPFIVSIHYQNLFST
jgi:hypothetical protein